MMPLHNCMGQDKHCHQSSRSDSMICSRHTCMSTWTLVHVSSFKFDSCGACDTRMCGSQEHYLQHALRGVPRRLTTLSTCGQPILILRHGASLLWVPERCGFGLDGMDSETAPDVSLRRVVYWRSILADIVDTFMTAPRFPGSEDALHSAFSLRSRRPKYPHAG